jgi:hypothetical protein
LFNDAYKRDCFAKHAHATKRGHEQHMKPPTSNNL